MRSIAHSKYIILSALLVLASINITRTAYDILKSSKRLDDLKSDIKTLEDNRNALLKGIEYKKTPVYIEERAREDLNMVKPGEKIIVFIGGKDSNTKDANTQDSASVQGSATQVDKLAPKESNPYLWFRLFFDK